MAASTGHVRSSSYPTSTHPLVLSVEEQLTILKSSQQETSTSMSKRLGGLKELYDRVDDMIHLGLSEALCLEHLEDVLDGSLRQLDVCGTIRDVLSRMRESLQALESSLRRGNGRESEFGSEIRGFMVTKKEMNKMISHCFRNMKGMYRMRISKSDPKMVGVVSMLKEAEEISLSVFDSLVSFLLLPKLRSKPIGWSIVSKVRNSKRASCYGMGATEAEKLEAELILMKSSKDIKVEQVQRLLSGLEAFQDTIKEKEEDLEFIFRQLLKTPFLTFETTNISKQFCTIILLSVTHQINFNIL